MLKSKNFTYWIIILPIIAILLTSLILTYQFISYQKEQFNKDSLELRNNYISQLKERIQKRVNRVINLIETNIKSSIDEEKVNIKNIINIGYSTIEETYERNKDKPYEQIIDQIRNQLENLRFYNNGSGYFFIIDLKDKILMQPITPSHVGRVLTNLQDKKGKYFIQSFRNIAQTKGEGFDTWSWHKPESSELKEKVGYIKLFKPLNLYIGTAKYSEDIQEKVKKESLKLIDIIKYGKDEYIFAIDEKGTTLSHINKAFIGKEISRLTKLEQTIIENILEKSSSKDGGFLGYTPTSHNIDDKKLSKKISYVNRIPSLNWTIGTGQYTTILQEQINKKTKELEEQQKDAINNIIIISIIISIILIFLLAYTAKQIQNKFKDYENKLNKNNQQLKELNKNLEETVNKQVVKIREKEQLIHQQSKLASMGEMLSNIAHQWRQPLSAISTAASGIKMQDELKILKKQDMVSSLDGIVHNTKLLSQTIDDFRNFFKKDKEKNYFKIENTVKKVLILLDATFKNKDITIIQNIQSAEIFNLENELTQVFLNILNNAKDAFEINRDIENKAIFIEVKNYKDEIYISIKDNAGGIDLDIINKIFEPYFTTKHQLQGTGIGLYMSQTIIVNHMKGQLDAKNITFEYKKKKYNGALFEIILNKKS